MEKLTESKFGKFEGKKIEELSLIKGGDKVVATGGGSEISNGSFIVWNSDSTYIFSNGNPSVTSKVDVSSYPLVDTGGSNGGGTGAIA